ncbi:MSO1 [[Candida] subhashii]|uniref:MSO1 n=1 Tax=[Candida] subhashii TaxID=561895 RepID=A0A8J5UJ11_9ASCO|nr:MSO1 [[Candida] subhashii]KAG7664068.1 MSO1 [[Candida] subhashii]
MQHHNGGNNSTGFFSKIKENYSSKLSNLSLTSNSYVDKDGNTEDSTLIHNAFVKYYDSKGLPYPDWLGVKNIPTHKIQQQSNQYQQQHQANGYSSDQFQPVRHSNTFNNSYSSRQQQQQQQQQQHHQQERPASNTTTTNTPGYRSQSKLQDMYNKSRQQPTPAASATYAPKSDTAHPQPIRTNSYSVTGNRLRERMLRNSPSQSPPVQPNPPPSNNSNQSTNQPSWGRR